jgi:small subunit ribosomal protein S16
MLTIRLSRIGKRKKPKYRLIISEKSKDPYGRVLETLGSYDPFSKELQAKGERINYWLSQGSGISATANNLLVGKGIIKGEKVKASKDRKKKAEEPAGQAAPDKKEEPKQAAPAAPENK